MKVSKDGGRLTIKEFYEIHFDDLFGYAKSITNSNDLAKDAVSDVFFYLLNSKIDLNYVKNVRGYLLKSVKNSCIKLVSKNPLQMEYLQDDKDFQIAEEINPQNILIGHELEDFLVKVIADLPPQAQLVFEMIRIDGKEQSEVSNELGISINTVRNHLASATKTIRLELEAYYSDKPNLGYSSDLGALILILLPTLNIFN